MEKVTYQFLAVVDLYPHVLAEYKGRIQEITVQINQLTALINHSDVFNKKLEEEVRKTFGITDPIELVDITPELPLPSGPHDAIGFGRFGEDS